MWSEFIHSDVKTPRASHSPPYLALCCIILTRNRKSLICKDSISPARHHAHLHSLSPYLSYLWPLSIHPTHPEQALVKSLPTRAGSMDSNLLHTIHHISLGPPIRMLSDIVLPCRYKCSTQRLGFTSPGPAAASPSLAVSLVVASPYGSHDATSFQSSQDKRWTKTYLMRAHAPGQRCMCHFPLDE